MRGYLQKIATGPELSKDLSRAEARDAMTLVLDALVDPVQAGVFLIALRMKRESTDENLGVLESIVSRTHTAIAEIDELLVLGDPFDGFERSQPMSPFLPALLAALGVPTVSHGVVSVGPKHGVTHAQVLGAAGVGIDADPQAAARHVADPAIGWAYVDQSRSCPALHALIELRELIVKRACITTIESVVPPLRARVRTHLLTGYVHKAYPDIYADLAAHAGYDSAFIVRGVEGGVIPSLVQPARARRLVGSSVDDSRFDPAASGVVASERAVDWPSASGAQVHDRAARAACVAQTGQAALRGQPGPAREALSWAAALVLVHLGRERDPGEAVVAARGALDDGRAIARFRSAAASPD